MVKSPKFMVLVDHLESNMEDGIEGGKDEMQGTC